MAKALLGHVARLDPHMAAELHRLRQRVCELEAELIRLRNEHGPSPSALHADRTGDARASTSMRGTAGEPAPGHRSQGKGTD
jgi:hypothetical protein